MSELTELEICKRIAEIKGHTVLAELPVGISLSAIYVHLNNGVKPKYKTVYNPLTDDTLTVGLIIDYHLEFGRYGTWYGTFQGNKPSGSDGCLSYELCLRKAVALAVIKLKGNKS